MALTPLPVTPRLNVETRHSIRRPVRFSCAICATCGGLLSSSVDLCLRCEGLLERHSMTHWPPPVGSKVYPVMADGSLQEVVGYVSSHGFTSPVLVVVWWPDDAYIRSHGPGHLVLVDDIPPSLLPPTTDT